MARRVNDGANEAGVPCPNLESMREVILGCAPRSLADQILTHLKGCSRCPQSFDQLEQELLDLPWTKNLREESSEFLDEPGLEQSLLSIQQIEQSYQELCEPERDLNLAGDSPLVSDDDPFQHLPLELRDYLLSNQIGSGSMGLIFKAQHRRLNKPVAIKVLRPDLNVDVRHLFDREI